MAHLYAADISDTRFGLAVVCMLAVSFIWALSPNPPLHPEQKSGERYEKQ